MSSFCFACQECECVIQFTEGSFAICNVSILFSIIRLVTSVQAPDTVVCFLCCRRNNITLSCNNSELDIWLCAMRIDFPWCHGLHLPVAVINTCFVPRVITGVDHFDCVGNNGLPQVFAPTVCHWETAYLLYGSHIIHWVTFWFYLLVICPSYWMTMVVEIAGVIAKSTYDAPRKGYLYEILSRGYVVHIQGPTGTQGNGCGGPWNHVQETPTNDQRCLFSLSSHVTHHIMQQHLRETKVEPYLIIHPCAKWGAMFRGAASVVQIKLFPANFPPQS